MYESFPDGLPGMEDLQIQTQKKEKAVGTVCPKLASKYLGKAGDPQKLAEL